MTWKHPEHNYPCECGTLESAAKDPDNPIIFDAKFREFQLKYQTTNGPAQMMIYYCPFCGGKTPGSIRNRFFARVTDDEFRRLGEKTKDIRSIDDAIRLLGKPDQDSFVGHATPEKQGTPETVEPYRSLVYAALSDTAMVRITDYGGTRVKIQYEGKFLDKDRTTDA